MPVLYQWFKLMQHLSRVAIDKVEMEQEIGLNYDDAMEIPKSYMQTINSMQFLNKKTEDGK